MESRALDRMDLNGGTAAAERDADLVRTQVIRLSGNLRDDQALCEFDHVSVRVIHPGRRRVVLDLEAVEEADTRLVAELITIIRRAVRVGVVWQVRTSEKMRHWISLYKLDRVLLPGLATPIDRDAANV